MPSAVDAARRGRGRTLPRDAFVLGIFLLVCFSAAGLGSAFTIPAVSGWYADLAKPAWTPPDAVFSPVWTVLFALMAAAGWLAWRTDSSRTLPFLLFGTQLLLNVAWSGLFFGLKSPGLAFADILLLGAAILGTALAFGRVRALAGWLLVPYLLWVSFAAALNFAIWRMNP